MTAVGIVAAARTLNKSPATLRRWIAAGAPTVCPGEVGRGRGAIVNPDDLLRWRHGVKQREADETLHLIASALLDFHRRDTGIDAPAHKTLGIHDKTAAALYITLFQYLAQRLNRATSHDLTEPDEIARLRAFCVR